METFKFSKMKGNIIKFYERKRKETYCKLYYGLYVNLYEDGMAAFM